MKEDNKDKLDNLMFNIYITIAVFFSIVLVYKIFKTIPISIGMQF